MSDYYRGSSSYEDAVKRKLAVIETTNVANTHAVNNNTRAVNEMNSDLRNAFQTTNNLLQENNDIMMAGFGATLAMGAGIRNDIQTNTYAIQDMALGLNSAIRENTYAVVASQEMLAQTFNQGYNAMNNMLDLGFSMINSKMDAMTDHICKKLDEIHGILNNPLLTESRELYRRALDEYKRGLYEEALESCIGAVEKNKSDFISWYLLGHIYLFGAGKFGSVIDIDKAEDAFFNAAKYIDYDLGKSDEANTLGSEIYYYLGNARLIKSNDLLVETKKEESIKKLEEAEKASREASRLSADNLLAVYEQAKELHFLDRDDEALLLIEKLIRADKNYALRVCNDKNFESLWDRIENLIKALRDELANKLAKGFSDVRALGRKGNEQLADIIFPDEGQIREFEQFYYSELIPKAVDTSLKQIICNDFDSLARTVFYKTDSCTVGKYKSVIISDKIIENIRSEKISWKNKFDKVESDIELEIGQLESMLKNENDYFSVLDKYGKFYGGKDNSQASNFAPLFDKLTASANSTLEAFDKERKNLKNDVKIIQSYLEAQHNWDKEKPKLRDKRKSEITKEWSEIHDSWKRRIDGSGNPHIYGLREYLSGILKNLDKKPALEAELNTIESRLKEVAEYFGNLQGDDYYSIIKKWKKLKKDNFLQDPSSYFNWSLSELDKVIDWSCKQITNN